MPDPCDVCDEAVEDALARTVRLSVDREAIDTQRLCPACFADWIDSYREEMQTGPDVIQEGDDEIIVD